MEYGLPLWLLFLLEAGPCRAAWRLYLSLGAVYCGTYLVFRCICLAFYRLLVPNNIPPDRQLRSLFEIWTFFFLFAIKALGYQVIR